MIKFTIIFISILWLVGCSTNKTIDQSAKKESIMEKANNYSGLVKLYSDKVKKSDSEENRFKLATYYYKLNDYEASSYHIENLLKRNSNNPEYLFMQSDNFYKLGKFKLSLRLINSAIKSKSDVAKYYNQKGIVLSSLKKYEDSIVQFNQARALLFDNTKIKNNIAVSLYMEGKYKESLGMLMPIYLRNPQDKKVTSNMILVLSKLRDKDYVMQILTEKYEVSRDEARVIYNKLA
ncbi:tetratricopeptide repeat protein [Dongshaea marina]|uniref:hypothetical protein n=1 Tax=Dongshaea marina TaxID=2047966 RepID=UPI000D3E97F5|nr:hypothetical protein [Dongshaea marina]